MPEPLWTPSPEQIDRANLTRFMAQLRAAGLDVADYPALYAWSIAQPAEFWRAVANFCGVALQGDTTTVVRGLRRMAPPDPQQGPWWFPDAQVSFARHLLWPSGGAGRWPAMADGPSGPQNTDPAIIAWNENGRHAWLTWGELRYRVGAVRVQLAAWGIRPGDRVAGFMPNIPEAVIAMLAATSLGAVWSSCSPDFGVQGVLDRFGQIAPRVLFTADGYQYNGKSIDSLARIREILPQLPSIEHVVVVEYMGHEPALDGLGTAKYYRELVGAKPASPQSGSPEIETGSGSQDSQEDGGEAGFAPTDYPLFPFNHPLYIMYSSGTTGLPKCMVHGAGGTLLQHLKELVLHTDVRPGERVFYFSTCGWMMWNWQVSALAAGATLVLYDGSPFAPRPSILWDMAAEERVNVFGTSAKYIALLEKEGVRPRESHDLSALRCICSTGSPLAPDSFHFVYCDVKADVQLASISGGTDIISCFALGNPIAPVYRGELQTRGLGMKVEVFDETGTSVVGQQGELVCTMPFPSMPVGFWNDADGSKYRAAYFEQYPGVWRHGDWCELVDHSADGQEAGLIIYGRSDATLNPGGVRIGTAEIYRQVEQLPEVVESLVVGQDWDGDTRIVLFVRLRSGEELDDALRQRICQHIRANTSPHHVPRRVVQVRDIPRTISGKIVELAVREVIHGRPVKNVDALANPDALEEYRDREELRS
jgi:acetoacetyl-CoA synthetase